MKRLLLILTCLTPLPALASVGSTSLPVTHGSIIRNTARITFEWPEAVHFSAHAKGNIVTITFDREANPDFGSMLAELYPYVISAKRNNDGKTIVLTLEKPYRIRTFISDEVSGIELLRINPEERISMHSASLAPTAGEPEANKPTAAPAPTVAPAATPAAVPAPATPAAPVAAATPPAATTPAAPAAAPAAMAPATPVAAATPPAPAAAPATPPAITTKTDGSAVSPAEEAKKSAATPASSPLKVGVSPQEDSAVLRFPFTTRTAVAVFTRANTLWIVFNTPVALDLSDFDSLPKTVVGKAELLPNTKATILRVPIDNTVSVTAAKQDNNFEWAVLLTPKGHPVANPLKIEVNTDPPAPANVFIPVLEMAEPVAVQDPSIGDNLSVVPLFSPDVAMATRRDFIEFSLLATSQGIAIAQKSDDVQVTEILNGLRVTTPQGATLTPGLPEFKTTAIPTEALQSGTTFFPYEQWKLDTTLPQHVQKRELFHRVVESNQLQEANNARLRLAQIDLSEGLPSEALGMLAGIERTNPIYYRSAKLAALRGAANFLMYRFGDAAHDFAAAELNNNKEIDYWRNMMADLLGNPGQYSYTDMNADYISKYPPVFRQRLAIVAADRAITAKEYNTAIKIFDTLRDGNLIDPIKSYVSFLMAKISADTGQEQDATDSWDKLAEDYEHPFVRARAEFSRIIWGMDHSTLTKDQVIDRLERLRLSWHGDGLEMESLKLLGDLYAERSNYVDAMRIWNDGVTSFPDTATAVDMSHKIEDAFVVMFSQGGADSMPTIDALTIYYEYRDFAPVGAVSSDMVDRLTDRLVTIDLLDQAALLLDHQMRFQSEKEKRSRLGTRLSTIYLLNHQPKKALEALEGSVYGENSILLRQLRNRLTAQAMMELGQPDKALQILGVDDSPDAQKIRLSIYWKQRDWAHVATISENILKNRNDITAPLAVDESETVLKLALAYVFQNNQVQLQYMRDYFGPLMANNPNKPVFDFVTAGDTAPNPNNFEEVVSKLSATQSFVDNYKARIQTAGLDALSGNGKTASAKQ